MRQARAGHLTSVGWLTIVANYAGDVCVNIDVSQSVSPSDVRLKCQSITQSLGWSRVRRTFHVDKSRLESIACLVYTSSLTQSAIH